MEEIQVKDKPLLTIKEAVQYFNIGETTLRKLVSDPKHSYSLRIGNKYLIKREEFTKTLLSSKSL